MMTAKKLGFDELGKRGGTARAKTLSAKRLKEIATAGSRAAAKARGRDAAQRHKLLAGGGWKYVGGRWEDPASKGLFTMKAALQMQAERAGKRASKNA